MPITQQNLFNNTEQHILDELSRIITDSDLETVLPFIKNYQEQYTALFQQALNQIKKYWLDQKDPSEISNYESLSWSDQRHALKCRATLSQQHIISLFAFGLLNNLNKEWKWHLESDLSRIFKQPSLFNILLNIPSIILEKCINQRTDYDLLYILEQKRLIKYNADIFIHSLIHHHSYAHENRYDDLLQFYASEKIVYTRDIPKIFDYEDYNYIFHDIIPLLIKENKIDHLFCIRRCLENQNKNWNDYAKKAFLSLIDKIKPTHIDYLQIQDSFFLLLQSEYNSTVNLALDMIQPLIYENNFQFDEYLNYLDGIMFRTGFKGRLKNLLVQLNQAIQDFPIHREQILLLINDALSQQDIDLQNRAAKILLKHITVQDQNIIDKIQLYAPSLNIQTKELLDKYIDLEVSEQNSINHPIYCYQPFQHQYLKPENKIELPQTWQDLLFLMSGNIQKGDPLNYDLIMSAWLTLKPHFPKDYKKQIRTVIKQMEKSTINDFQNIFQYFFIEIFKTPEKAPDPKTTPYASLQYLNSNFKRTFFQLLESFAKFSYENTRLPLLSLPTHTPSYIDPEILVQRLLDYQTHNIEFDLVDLALALCRTPRENVANALYLLAQLQHPQLQQLLYYAFGKSELSSDFNHEQSIKNQNQQQAWWGLWDTLLCMYEPNRQQQNHIPFTITLADHHYSQYGRLCFEAPTQKQSLTAIYNELNRANFDYYFSGLDHIFYRHLTPLYQVPNDLSYLRHYANEMEGLGKNMYQFFNYLSNENYTINDYTLLILATHSFTPAKQSRLAVTETLIQFFDRQSICLETLAQYYAQLIYVVYEPFSRLLEVFSQIKDCSNLNNSALIQLITIILKQEKYPEKLPPNFKKLFELYYELITQHHILLDQETKNTLQAWQIQFPTLKSIIQKILKQGA